MAAAAVAMRAAARAVMAARSVAATAVAMHGGGEVAMVMVGGGGEMGVAALGSRCRLARAHLCLRSMAAIACSTRCGSPALRLKHLLSRPNFCVVHGVACEPVPNLGENALTISRVIPMGTFASNVIGSHGAPPDATLLLFFRSTSAERCLFACGPKRAIL